MCKREHALSEGVMNFRETDSVNCITSTARLFSAYCVFYHIVSYSLSERRKTKRQNTLKDQVASRWAGGWFPSPSIPYAAVSVHKSSLQKLVSEAKSSSWFEIGAKKDTQP